MSADNAFLRKLERALDGDRKAQTTLYIEYGDHIRRIVRHKLRELRISWAVEADDIFDSVFVRLFKPRHPPLAFDDALHFVNYLEKSARNKARQALRKVMRSRAVCLDDCPAELTSIGNEDIVDIEITDELAAAYAKLTSLELQTCLFVLEELSWQEAGDRLNISADAARMAHQRAQAKVRRHLLAGGG